MFNNYNDLINFAKSQNRFKGMGIYYELHHILPRNMGGTDDNSNLVLLTLSEHVEAHYLLALENDGKDQQAYVANIQAAWFISHGKSKFSPRKRQEIENWLKNEEAQKLTEELKLRLKAERPNRRGISLQYNDRIWAQKATQKPVRLLERNLGKGCWIGYTKISCCPICSWPNSEKSFACSEAHEKQYLEDLKNKYKEEKSNQVKESWQNEDIAKKRITSLTGIKKINNNIWITNGLETKMIDKNQLEQYISIGWKEGRLNIQGVPQTEEYKQKLSERRRNSCYVKKDGVVKEIKLAELDSYLSDGWARGTYGTSRKGIKQPAMAWVHNSTEIKRIRKENLQEYLDSGWIKGRK